MENKEGQNWFSSFWRAIRWPLTLAFLAFAVVIFSIGVMSALGYQGTTPLRAVSSTNKLWTDFTKLFQQQKGAPYFWNEDVAPQITYGLVKFDQRLIRVLTYLSKKKDTKCGWDGQHQIVGLKVGGPVNSDTSYPPENLPSVATLYRGTGVRIVAADEIKCTKIPLNSNCDVSQPTVFDHKLVPFGENTTLNPDKPYDQADCKVTCAVDYYPDNPINAPADEINSPDVSPIVSRYNPGEFDYQTIAENGKQAAVYKAAEIGYELMQVDEAGCDSPTGNKGFNRKIPFTLIYPQWIMGRMGDGWGDLVNLANIRFPHNFQKSSPLAGLTYDPLLNDDGLHLNF